MTAALSSAQHGLPYPHTTTVGTASHMVGAQRARDRGNVLVAAT